jgi:hypothetical protein
MAERAVAGGVPVKRNRFIQLRGTCRPGRSRHHKRESKKSVRSARRYPHVQIQIGTQTLTAQQPPPEDLRAVLDQI